jgi:hypothetical protein
MSEEIQVSGPKLGKPGDEARSGLSDSMFAHVKAGTLHHAKTNSGLR